MLPWMGTCSLYLPKVCKRFTVSNALPGIFQGLIDSPAVRAVGSAVCPHGTQIRCSMGHPGDVCPMCSVVTHEGGRATERRVFGSLQLGRVQHTSCQEGC